MEEIFRFVTISPPDTAVSSDAEWVSTGDTESVLQSELVAASEDDAPGNAMQQLAESYMKSGDFIGTLSQVELPMRAFAATVGEQPTISLSALERSVETVFGKEAGALVDGTEYRTLRRALNDSLISYTLVNEPDSTIHDDLVLGLRLCGLIERIAASDAGLDSVTEAEALIEQTIVLPDTLFPLLTRAAVPRAEASVPSQDQPTASGAAQPAGVDVDARLAGIRAAATELMALGASDFRSRVVTSTRAASSRSVQVSEAQPVLEISEDWWLLSNDAINGLSDETQTVLRDFNIDLNHLPMPQAVEILESTAYQVSAESAAPGKPGTVVSIGNTMIDLEEYFVTATQGAGGRGDAFRAVGIGDLEIVKQELQKYELGEIAHVENVLLGERKERSHRRTKKTELTVLTEKETEEETEKDLQSTDRFEMQTESQQTIKEDTSFDASVTVKYGGIVDVTATAKFGYNKATEETSKKATNYARDVTARTVNRIKERVKEKTVKVTVQEVEEKNLHELNNKKGKAHVTGVYRWLDKVYEAQVYNYGKRLMFEFIVPEPAAFTLYAHAKSMRAGINLKKPVSPKNRRGAALRPADIEPDNYEDWLAQYEVTDVEPPPPRTCYASYVYRTKKEGEGYKDHVEFDDRKLSIEGAKEIFKIPKGYQAHAAWGLIALGPYEGAYQLAYRWEGRTLAHVNVGTQHYGATNDRWTTPFRVDLRYGPTEVPLSVSTVHKTYVTVNIDFLCYRTAKALDEWRLKTYESIMTAYLSLKSEYEEELAAKETAQGVAIGGRNPKLNRELERTELKKGALTILTQHTSPHFDYAGSTHIIQKTDTKKDKYQGHPEIDFAEIGREAPYIQFMEQAFEWDQMSYLFYPYYWARKSAWATLQQMDDKDPVHAQFLRAGAARALVPVRPGYEEDLLYYLDTNKIWKGSGPPGVSSKLYVSLVQAIKEKQGFHFAEREGTINMTKGARSVTGNGTRFSKLDVDREILIDRKRYRIAKVVTPNEIVLSEAYRGASDSDVAYSVGLLMVGSPWEVRVPTSLVLLQKEARLPDFSQ